MTVKDALKRSLLNYPTIFPNAFSVYHHWFCVVGNGYEWKDGELVHKIIPGYEDNLAEDKDQAIIRYLNDNLINEWKEDGTARRFLKLNMSDEEDITKYVIRHNKDVIEDIKRIIDIEQRMKDFTIRKNIDLYADKSEFKFYPLSKYSHICDIPDNIKPEWLSAVMEMVKIMDANQEKIEDPENFFPKVKERVKELYDKLHNMVTWNGADRWEIIDVDVEDVCMGSHGGEIDVYVCRNLHTGEKKRFYESDVNRLI